MHPSAYDLIGQMLNPRPATDVAPEAPAALSEPAHVLIGRILHPQAPQPEQAEPALAA